MKRERCREGEKRKKKVSQTHKCFISHCELLLQQGGFALCVFKATLNFDNFLW